MIYILIFLILAFLALLDLMNDTKTIKAICFGFVTICLITLSSIRWETGPDWNSYFEYYRDIELYTTGSLAYANLMEPGYAKINFLIYQFGFNYTFFLTVLAFITIGLKAKVIYHHKVIMMTALFLYYCYYLGDIASVRQFTALSITLLSSLFIVKRKPVIFCLLVLAASTIHIASIFFIFGYWVYHRSHSKKLLYFVLIITLILGVINIAGVAVNFVINLVGGDSNIAIKLLNYQEQGLESTMNPYMSFIIGIAKRIIVLPLFIWGVKIVDEKYKERYIGYLNLLVCGNAIYFLFALSIPVLQRLSVPFLIFEIFLWGYLMVSFKDLPLRFSFYFLIVVFGALRLYTFMLPYKVYYFPFKTIF